MTEIKQEKYFQKAIKCKFHRKIQVIKDLEQRIKQWKGLNTSVDCIPKIYGPIYENYLEQGHSCQGLINHNRHENIFYEGLTALYNSMMLELEKKYEKNCKKEKSEN